MTDDECILELEKIGAVRAVLKHCGLGFGVDIFEPEHTTGRRLYLRYMIEMSRNAMGMSHDEMIQQWKTTNVSETDAVMKECAQRIRKSSN